MIAMLAAALLAGNLSAQTASETDAMINRLFAARDQAVSSPAEVAALLSEAKNMGPASWAYGTLTKEQESANMLIHATATLMARKVSFATALDHVVGRSAWELAVLYGRRAPDPKVAIGYAAKWVEADPSSLSARIELLLVRAIEGKEDIRGDLDALLAANPGGLSGYHGYRAIFVWNNAAKLHAGPIPLADAEAFLTRLEAAVAQDPANLRQARLHALAYRASLGGNVNAEIMALLGTVHGTLPLGQAEILFGAFFPAKATNTEALAFYDAMLRAVEANAKSAPFLRKILDQKTKLQ